MVVEEPLQWSKQADLCGARLATAWTEKSGEPHPTARSILLQHGLGMEPSRDSQVLANICAHR